MSNGCCQMWPSAGHTLFLWTSIGSCSSRDDFKLCSSPPGTIETVQCIHKHLADLHEDQQPPTPLSANSRSMSSSRRDLAISLRMCSLSTISANILEVNTSFARTSVRVGPRDCSICLLSHYGEILSQALPYGSIARSIIGLVSITQVPCLSNKCSNMANDNLVHA